VGPRAGLNLVCLLVSKTNFVVELGKVKDRQYTLSSRFLYGIEVEVLINYNQIAIRGIC